MSHLMLALSASLQEVAVGAPAHDFSDASLQAFALMSRELGRVMSTLVQVRRQVWWKSAGLLSLRCAGEPSAVFQWNLGSCLALQL